MRINLLAGPSMSLPVSSSEFCREAYLAKDLYGLTISRKCHLFLQGWIHKDIFWVLFPWDQTMKQDGTAGMNCHISFLVIYFKGSSPKHRTKKQKEPREDF
uniref:Uncharacterized protein n=1 Tax=Rhizophora mucronata TaxID=61149 RepID=A0A2P2K3E0_RHIMU